MGNERTIVIKIGTDGTASVVNDVDKVSDSIKRMGDDTEKHGGRLNTAMVNAASALYLVKEAAHIAEQGYDLLIGKTVEAGTEFAKTSQQIGISVEHLSGLKYAAELSETSYGALTTGVRIFSRSLTGMNEEGKDTSQLLRQLGVNSKDTYTALLQAAGAFSKMEDGAGKTTAAMQIFGRSGAQLIPFFNEGAEGIRKLQEQAHRANVTFSTESAMAAKEFGDHIKELKENINGLTYSIANGLIPALNNLFLSIKREGMLGTFVKIVRQDHIEEVNKQIDNYLNMLKDASTNGYSWWKKLLGADLTREEIRGRLEDLYKYRDSLVQKYNEKFPWTQEPPQGKPAGGGVDFSGIGISGAGAPPPSAIPGVVKEILPGQPGSEAYEEWEALQMALEANKAYYAEKEALRQADKEAEFWKNQEVLQARIEAAQYSQKLDQETTMHAIGLKFQLANQAAGLLTGMIKDQKAAALVGIAIRTALAFAENKITTLANAELAFGSQLIPGVPASLIAAQAAYAAVMARGIITGKFILASGALSAVGALATPAAGGGEKAGGSNYYTGGGGTIYSPTVVRQEDQPRPQVVNHYFITFDGPVYDLDQTARKILPAINKAREDMGLD